MRPLTRIHTSCPLENHRVEVTSKTVHFRKHRGAKSRAAKRRKRCSHFDAFVRKFREAAFSL